MRINTFKRLRGFSLVELMIAVAIVGILGMVAYPSFMQSVRKSNRVDAHAALTRAANNQERFFSANSSYTTDASQLGLKMDGGSATSDDGHYGITIAAGPSGIGSSYVIKATAKAGDTQAKDTGCQTMSIDSAGRRVPDPSSSKCW